MHRTGCLRCHPVRVVRYCMLLLLCAIVGSGIWKYLIGSTDTLTPIAVHDEYLVNEFVAHHAFETQRIHVRAKTRPLLDSKHVQEILDYIGQNLNVRYDVVANDGGRFHVDIILTNVGSATIEPCCWSIYFAHMKFIDTFTFNAGMPIALRGEDLNILKTVEVQFEISHINGYTFRLQPNGRFKGLGPGASQKMRFTGGGWAVSRSEVIPNWYVTHDDSPTQPRIIQSTAGDQMEFVGEFDTTGKSIRGDEDFYRPFSPEQRFRRNKVVNLEVENLILPTPLNVNHILPKQTVTVDVNTWKVAFTADLTNEANYIRDVLNIQSEQQDDTSSCSANTITLRLSKDDIITANSRRLHMPEAYRLNVDSKRNCILITGRQAVGVFYGAVSLVSLIQGTREFHAVNNGLYQVDTVEIEDAPRYEYRGVMVDVARNFQPVQRITKLMDAMAIYKLNKLHLHLADDEGWRLEIPEIPELTVVGGYRSHNPKEEEHLMSMLGSGPFANTSGSGYYTVADYRKILEHAASRHIEIIPEFDMPSHSHAAIKSMEYRYRHLEKEVEENVRMNYLLSDLSDRSIYMTGQFFRDSAINPCIESSYRFVETVMLQLINMHKDILPLRRWHFGGDEVPQDAYSASPACRALIHQHPQLSSTKELKTYFVKRIIAIAARHGLAMFGWEDAFTTSYGLPIERSLLKTSEDVVSQAYYNTWESGAAMKAYQYANAGYKVVLSPITALYFDNPQEPDPEEWGLHWATRYVDTKRAFRLSPDSLYDSIDEDFWGRPTSKSELCDTHRIQCPMLRAPQNILGLEAALWSELIRTSAHMDGQLWPRLLAVAERSWHKASWEESLSGGGGSSDVTKALHEDYSRFARLVGHKELRRLENMGVLYYLPRPGARAHNGKLYVNTAFPGLTVQISMDDGKTWQDYKRSSVYTGSVLLSTRSFDGTRKSLPVKMTL